MIDSNNRKFWNIFKGLSILFIVIGHSCYFLVPFVYLFHLAIFFFIGGYLYNEDKYGNDPGKYLLVKLKTNWPKFFGYSMFFLILHNLFTKLGLIISEPYLISQMVPATLNTAMFFGTEALSGALWFVPVYIVATVGFGFIVYYSNKIKISKKLSAETNKNIIIIGLSCLCGIVGCYFILRNLYVMLHVHTSFLIMPIIMSGYYVKKYIKNLDKVLKFIPFVIVTAILGLLAYKTSYRVNLTDNITGNFILFYIVSILGTYFTLYLSKIVYKIKYVDNYFGMLGKYSFEIMAFHFLVFKIIDFLYSLRGIMNNTISVNVYGAYPYAFKCLWPVYIVLGATIPALIFLFIDKVKENKFELPKKIKSFFNNKKVIISMVVLLSIVVILPLLKCGIMHNDELMSRLWSYKGFPTFYTHYFNEQLEKGRALSSVFIPATQYLGFIGQDTYQFKIMQVVSIFACLGSMCYFLKKVFNDKKLILLYALIFISFLQISFEPTVPNVFVTFYNVSICGLLFSLGLYVDYLKNGNIKKLLLSMLIFAIVEVTYESFVTYVPLYLLLYIYFKGFKNLFKDLKAILLPIGIGVVYLGAYIVATKLFPSNYAGNQIGNINIIQSLKLIVTLGYYSMPGSYLTSGKYQYLLRFHMRGSKLDLIRLAIFIIPFIILFFVSSRKDKDKNKTSIIDLIKVLFISGVAVILPLLPISVASMYQEMQIGTVTLGLPVSFFSYFASVLIITIIVKFVSDNFKLGKYAMFAILLFMVIGVQTMNNTFSREANKDFRRIQYIERFVESGIANEVKDKEIYTEDLFLTKHTLFVHDTHWNEYAKAHNIDLTFTNSEGKLSDSKLYLNDTFNMFIYSIGNKNYIITEYELNGDIKDKVTETKDLKLKDNWKIYTIDDKECLEYLMTTRV